MCTQKLTNLSVPSVIFADDAAEEEMTPWYDTGVVWYGSLRGGVEFGGGKDARFADGGSRWGIKGSNEVSEGLSAVYRFEAKIDSATATQPAGDRLSYVGLSGGFGTLAMGRVGSAGGNSTGGILDGSSHYGNSYTGFRTGNAISYSNSVGGVSVQLDAIMDPKKDSGNAIDETQLGLSLNLGDFGKLAVSHVNVEDTMDDGMVDVVTHSEKGGIALAHDGTTTGVDDLVWRDAKTRDLFDADTAKNVEFSHSTGTGSNKLTVMKMKVTHAKGAQPTSTLKMGTDGIIHDDTDCSTPANCETTYRWVSMTKPVNPGAATDEEGMITYAVVDNAEVVHTATATVAEVTPGSKASHIAAEFGLGGITAFLGYSQVESNKKGAKKDKITHYGIRGGLGESGVNFLVQLRSEDLQGSAPMDADRDPYVVNMSKSLGDGASAYIEHGTGDAKGEKANTRIGMIVNF